MKTCNCGYSTTNKNVKYCDKCGALLNCETQEEVRRPVKKEDVNHHHGHGMGLGSAIMVALISVAGYIGYVIYMKGISELATSIQSFSILIIVSLILIIIVSIITSKIMNVDFGGIVSYIFKMISVITIAETLTQIIPIPFLGPIIAFIVFIGLVEYFFDLQWDALIVFGICMAIIYILGRMWLEGLFSYLERMMHLNIIILWRYIITWLTV